MASRSPSLEDLILTIHSSALEEEGWSKIVERLSRAFSADRSGLVKPSGRPNVRPWCRLFEVDPAFMTEYASHWGHHDLMYQGAVRTRRLGIGLVNLDSQLVDYQEYRKSAFYNEFLKPMNIDRMMNMCIAPAEPDGSYGTSALSFYRGNGKEAFSAEQAALFSRLAPHLTVAAQNHWATQSLRLLDRARSDALDALTSAVFGIERSGHVVFVNKAGQDLAHYERWVRISRGVLETPAAVVEGRSLILMLSKLACGIGFKLILTDRITGEQAIVSGAPLVPSEISPYPTVQALVWVTPCEQREDIAADLAALFGLTRAERRLLDRLIAGENLRDAAAALQISLHTARTQLKATFSKTGRRSQGALLTLVTKLSILRATRR
jgi:DNA-binding CsgD family transcriptional regulator